MPSLGQADLPAAEPQPDTVSTPSNAETTEPAASDTAAPVRTSEAAGTNSAGDLTIDAEADSSAAPTPIGPIPQASLPPMSAMTIAALILINVIWSASTVAAKYALYITHPMSLAFFRFSSATILMYVIARIMKVDLRVARGDLGSLWAMGALGLSCTYGLFYYGLQHGAPPSHAALLNAMEPIIVTVLAALLLREKVSFAKVAAIGVGLLGVYLIIDADLRPTVDVDVPAWGSNSVFFGDAIIILALICEALSLLLGKRLVSRYPPIAVMTYLMATGTIALIPFCAYEVWEYPPQLAVWIPIAVGSLGFLIIACTVVGYTVFYTILDKRSAGELSVFMYLQPIGGAILGHYFFSDVITPSILGGGLLILVAIAILNRSGKATPPPPTST